MSFKRSNLEELVFPLRIQIGDIGAIATFSDERLHDFLRMSVADLMRRWNDKYYIDNDGVVHRNPNITFEWSNPPEIQHKDRRPIVLQASVMIKGGLRFSGSGSTVTWRDEEISFSNVEAARQMGSSLQDDIAELNALLPKQKLAYPVYGDLPGWDISPREWDQ